MNDESVPGLKGFLGLASIRRIEDSSHANLIRNRALVLWTLDFVLRALKPEVSFGAVAIVLAIQSRALPVRRLRPEKKEVGLRKFASRFMLRPSESFRVRLRPFERLSTN